LDECLRIHWLFLLGVIISQEQDAIQFWRLNAQKFYHIDNPFLAVVQDTRRVYKFPDFQIRLGLDLLIPKALPGVQ
jgi:hypothetical protein